MTQLSSHLILSHLISPRACNRRLLRELLRVFAVQWVIVGQSVTVPNLLITRLNINMCRCGIKFPFVLLDFLMDTTLQQNAIYLIVEGMSRLSVASTSFHIRNVYLIRQSFFRHSLHILLNIIVLETTPMKQRNELVLLASLSLSTHDSFHIKEKFLAFKNFHIDSR